MSAYASEAMTGNIPGFAKAVVARQLDRSQASSYQNHSVYPLQLHQLVQQMGAKLSQCCSVLASWLMYLEPVVNQRRCIPWQTDLVHSDDASTNEAVLSYLAAETWKTAIPPTARLSKLTIPGAAHVYIYPITQQETDLEYWLLWLRDPLSDAGCQSLEMQAQLLSHSLNWYQECCRQGAKAQLLEQIIQRTEHQLRNPLALIELHASTLEMGLQANCPQEQVRSQVSLIQETTVEMGHCLRELAACAQQTKLQVAPHDLKQILQDALRQLQPLLAQKQLQMMQSPDSVLLNVDFWQLKQVLINLISNAVHFSPQEGMIFCQWHVFHQEVLIEIRDQGPGLSEQDLTRIFTPFYSRRPGGTGLGLSISQKIVLDHQGRIWAQNLPGGGAGFSIALPR